MLTIALTGCLQFLLPCICCFNFCLSLNFLFSHSFSVAMDMLLQFLVLIVFYAIYLLWTYCAACVTATLATTCGVATQRYCRWRRRDLYRHCG
jgi:putative flippase GtrA